LRKARKEEGKFPSTPLKKRGIMGDTKEGEKYFLL